MLESKQPQEKNGGQTVLPQIGSLVQWESGGQVQFTEPKRVRGLTEDGLWAFVDGSDTGLPVKELTVVSVGTIEKPTERIAAIPPAPPALMPELASPSLVAPKMRSYSWALSGDFSAKMDLFGDARADEDIDALAEYVQITIKALKRSLAAQKAPSGKN